MIAIGSCESIPIDDAMAVAEMAVMAGRIPSYREWLAGKMGGNPGIELDGDTLSAMMDGF